jgi:hypothetical protein
MIGERDIIDKMHRLILEPTPTEGIYSPIELTNSRKRTMMVMNKNGLESTYEVTEEASTQAQHTES